MNSLKFSTWNARSVLNKKSQVESLLHAYDLDVLSVSETWLSPDCPVWQIGGYLTFRRDRMNQQRDGGSMLLIRSSLIVSPINVDRDILVGLDVVGVSVSLQLGSIQFISVYAPPRVHISRDTWDGLLQCCDFSNNIVLCGDFNAHSWAWGSRYNDPRGLVLNEVVDDFDLVVFNDSQPTYVRSTDGASSNLDLVLLSSHLAQYSSTEVLTASFTSDHFPVVYTLDISPKFINDDCDEALDRRRLARREILGCQTGEMMDRFKVVDNEIKWFLRQKKKESFVSFCDSIKPSIGSKEIWSKVRAFSNAIQPLRSGVCNDPESALFKSLQDEFVREDIFLSFLPPVPDPVVACVFNDPFFSAELSSALAKCRRGSSLGLDSISNDFLLRLPSLSHSLLLELFNAFYSSSCFPVEWKNARVIFIPKPGGKGYRPISLTSNVCKLFERLIQRRLEQFVEAADAIPRFQFGFRRGRSSLDCVATLVTDVHLGFAKGEHTFASALDIKGAFNNVSPLPIYRRLIELDAPSRITNFVSFLVSSRCLYFLPGSSSSRTTGVRVPQGGVIPTSFQP